MSIAPPSDIVLDVAQAADPQKLQEAQAKLARIAAGASSGDFSSVLGGAGGAVSAPTAAPVSLPIYASAPTHTGKPMSPYQKFEAVLLQNLMIDILPKDTNLFGDAASADINRSMLAEQLANQIARTNKIGISQMVEKAHGPSSLGAPAHAPPSLAIAAPASSDAALTALSLPATRRGKE